MVKLLQATISPSLPRCQGDEWWVEEQEEEEGGVSPVHCCTEGHHTGPRPRPRSRSLPSPWGHTLLQYWYSPQDTFLTINWWSVQHFTSRSCSFNQRPSSENITRIASSYLNVFTITFLTHFSGDELQDGHPDHMTSFIHIVTFSLHYNHTSVCSRVKIMKFHFLLTKLN